MSTIPGQTVAPCEQSLLHRGFVTPDTDTLISSCTTTAWFMCVRTTADAVNRQRWIAVFPAGVTPTASYRLLGIGPADRGLATGRLDIGQLIMTHDARSISGSSNIIEAVRQRTVLQQCRVAAGSAPPGPTHRRLCRRAWGGWTSTHLLQHGRLAGSDLFILQAFTLLSSRYLPRCSLAIQGVLKSEHPHT
ncbi:MAG: hypothetical protein LKG73_08870 [Acetobacter sp.]|jgi:hypothetical protein|nr:hypothetical protein [Acetobacter sp.]